MRLFIRIKDGQPFEHPIMEDNFILAFPEIDLNNLPPEFAEFIRIGPPSYVGPYERYDGVTYEWDGNKVKDVHHMYQFTEQEKLAKQNAVKQEWVAGNNFASWVFDENSCTYAPPIERPTDGKNYTWDESTTSWTEVPPGKISVLPSEEIILRLSDENVQKLRENIEDELLPQLEEILSRRQITNG
jgi:hypothetical protein